MDTHIPCTIGLASNTPDRAEQIERAIDFLKSMLTQVTVSEIYEADAFNGKDKPYLNAVVHGKSQFGYDNTVTRLKAYEVSQGRTDERSASGEVPIDLDLVIWDSRIRRPKDFERPYFNKGYSELLAKGAFLD